jgi:hypothetical protein
MNTINRNTKSSNFGLLRHTAVILTGAALFTLPAAVLAHTVAADDSASYEVEKLVSASEAKRMARLYLSKQGFSTHIGPGAARIKSVTLNAGTWIVAARVSVGGRVLSRNFALYIDAQTGIVSHIPPTIRPTQVAAE